MKFLWTPTGVYVNSAQIVTIMIVPNPEGFAIVAYDTRGTRHVLRTLPTREEAEARLDAIRAGLDA